jgi:hypothetical protein
MTESPANEANSALTTAEGLEELSMLLQRWQQCLDAQQAGWRLAAEEQRAYETCCSLINRIAELRETLPHEVEVLLPCTLPDRPCNSQDEQNQLFHLLGAAGGWVRVREQHSEHLATKLHQVAIDWGRARTDKARHQAEQQFEALLAEAEAAEHL